MMEGGGSVPGAETTACGRRRYKAVAPWRFQLDFVRQQVKPGARSDSNRASERDANCEAGIDCNLEGDGATREAEPTNPQGVQLNAATATGKENSPPRDSKSKGFGAGGDAATGTGCRKGRKALAPWRFQKRPWPFSQGLSPGNGSDGPPETRETSKFEDGSRQCSPATNRKRSRIEVSATKNPSTAQVQRGAASVPKNKKITPKNRVAVTRDSVMASLQEFRLIYRNILEEENSKRSNQEDGIIRHDDLAAFQAFRQRFCVEYGDRRYEGSLPGVQVGDVFDSDMELFLVGLHRSQGSSVDYIKKGRACLAVSIVSYAQQSALNNNLDFLLHIGSTAATAEQKMEGTDLALKRSMDAKTHVRVIYRSVARLGESSRSEGATYYVYGGLYLVEKFCREKLTEDRFVNTFHFRRMPGQPHINIQELVKKRMSEPSNIGSFIADISAGLENIPISAINLLSNEEPMPFYYISHMQYPINNQLEPTTGCDCVGGCSNSPKCACAVKNGGKIPFGKNGRIFGESPLVYECGPSCKCPPTCHNKVSQRGIRFRLQVFKTKSMGWGVRSLDFIPNGSFVCEYIGQLVKDEDARKTENDEYLFNIGHNYYDVSRWESLINTIPSLQNGPGEAEVVFAVDALKRGNFARFINHSCTPNLFSQNVLYEYDDKSMPHIMLFADVDIIPLQPLSYDYNYTIDGVTDSDGNIKKKQCFCGSTECSGWLY